ncbi:hypothetical protein HUU05_10800 [candidate division KSB1 bacterium]|nr:hypothetical protein [candidate division KSB1 bacterium]
MNPSNFFRPLSCSARRGTPWFALVFLFSALTVSLLQAQSNPCNPQLCGFRSIFPILQGGQKGVPIQVESGDVVCVDIRMENSAVPIDAYGYTVQYDPTRLTLQSIQSGGLVSEFLVADCNQPSPGTVVCSGFDDDVILANSSGVLATLCFVVTSPPGVTVDSSNIVVTNLLDDLQTMAGCCNRVICTNPVQVPCSGAALYLAQSGAAIGTPVAAKSGDTFTLTVGIKDIPQPVDSFSFAINFDSAALKFVSATAGNLLGNFLQKECREILAGTLTCSGENNIAIPARSTGTLFEITFLAQCTVGDTSALTLNTLAKDFAGVQACNTSFICKGCEPANCPGAALYIVQTGKNLGEKLTEQDGDSVRFEVRIKSNPQGVSAYGFRLQYDPNVLSFGGASRGTLTNNFIASTAKELAPGTLMCAGFGTTPIPANSQGALLQFTFGVQCNVGDSTELEVTDLTDDIAGLQPCCNLFACAPCDHDGDLNTDKALSAGDALCAFEIFLNGGILSASCDLPAFACELIAADVNCDNAVTSRDALAIFARALQNLPPSECFAKPASSFVEKSNAPMQLRLINGNAASSDTLCVQMQIMRPQALHAFGLLLQYPARDLKFVGVRRTTATQNWFALDGQEYLPGLAVIGGFNPSELSAETPTTIFEAVFVNSGVEIDNSTFAVANLTDDFTNAAFTSALTTAQVNATPRQFKLYQNYPNPLQLRNAASGTAIQYDLPAMLASGSVKVEVVIYNLQGQIVKRLFSGQQAPGAYTLTWDGRDDAGALVTAGSYHYRMSAGSYVEKRKLVIVK